MRILFTSTNASIYQILIISFIVFDSSSFDFRTITNTQKHAAYLPFFPYQHYNKNLSNETLGKWRIQKEESLQEIFHNLFLSKEKDFKNKIEKSQLSSRTIGTEIGYVLKVLYIDADIIVVNKPSGILSVPGPRRHYSILDKIYDEFAYVDYNPDQMICHRLDMDTSGTVVYARTIDALKSLQEDFRARENIKKIYEALVCGHVSAEEGEIDLSLELNEYSMPFVCVSSSSFGSVEKLEQNVNSDSSSSTEKNKSSLTYFQVIKREFCFGYPVTRLKLIPFTGRTHQLRVHCAAIGHPIVADPIYGIHGQARVIFANDADSEAKINSEAQLNPEAYQEMMTQSNLKLCLHARKLHILHPITRAPIIFESEVPF